jgi:hypothetical protein
LGLGSELRLGLECNDKGEDLQLGPVFGLGLD